ncbi:MAG: hypothetical protein AABY95_10165 [Pseudomonadota bacterium]
MSFALSVVIPCYNESRSVADLLRRVRAAQFGGRASRSSSWTTARPTAAASCCEVGCVRWSTRWCCASGGAINFLIAHSVTTLCLLAAFVMFYCWLIALELGPARAMGVALFALMPGTFLQSFYPHPEGLYGALVFVALTSVLKAEATADRRTFWVVSVAIAVALVTRTVGVTLLPALALTLLRHRTHGGTAAA